MFVEIIQDELVNPSPKLAKYLKKIELETSQEITFNYAPTIDEKRPTLQFQLFPTFSS